MNLYSYPSKLPSASSLSGLFVSSTAALSQRAEASSSSQTSPPPKSFINIFIRFITSKCGSNDPMCHRYVSVCIVVAVAFMNSKIVPSSRGWPSTAASFIGICLAPIILLKTSNPADYALDTAAQGLQNTADRRSMVLRSTFLRTEELVFRKLANAKVTRYIPSNAC
eukprot:scaffold5539_cov81-Skeletonema_menzelii.AAC.21